MSGTVSSLETRTKTSVPTNAALSALDPTAFSNGELAYVELTKIFYFFDLTATVGGANLVTRFNVGAWVPFSSNTSFTNEPNWYFSPIGDDANVGTDPLFPLIRFTEAQNRLGPNPQFEQPTTFHVAAGDYTGFLPDDYIFNYQDSTGLNGLTILGEETIASSGDILSVTVKDTTTPGLTHPTQITTSVDVTPFTGKHIKIPSMGLNGAYALILDVLAGTVSTSNFVETDDVSSGFSALVDPTTSPYEIIQMPQLPGISIFSQGQALTIVQKIESVQTNFQGDIACLFLVCESVGTRLNIRGGGNREDRNNYVWVSGYLFFFGYRSNTTYGAAAILGDSVTPLVGAIVCDSGKIVVDCDTVIWHGGIANRGFDGKANMELLSFGTCANSNTGTARVSVYEDTHTLLPATAGGGTVASAWGNIDPANLWQVRTGATLAFDAAYIFPTDAAGWIFYTSGVFHPWADLAVAASRIEPESFSGFILTSPV